jgi:hypothetical protein
MPVRAVLRGDLDDGPCGDDRTCRRHRPSAAAPLEGTGIRSLSGWRQQAFRSCRRPGRRPRK